MVFAVLARCHKGTGLRSITSTWALQLFILRGCSLHRRQQAVGNKHGADCLLHGPETGTQHSSATVKHGVLHVSALSVKLLRRARQLNRCLGLPILLLAGRLATANHLFTAVLDRDADYPKQRALDMSCSCVCSPSWTVRVAMP
jgi:hypothetical protein